MHGCDRCSAAPGALLRARLGDAAARARASREAGHRAYLVGGSVRDALPRPSSVDSDVDITTDARPDVIERRREGLGRRGLAAGRAVRDRRLREGRRALRDHDVPRRGLPRRQPQARGHVLRRHRDRPLAARLHDQRDGDRARRARARRPARRPRRPRGPAAAHAALARGLVRRRPAAHAARGALRRDARLRARRRRSSHAIEQMRERLQIISAERIRDELSKLLSPTIRRPGSG